MTAYAKLAIALAVLLAGFAAGWVAQGLRKDAEMNKYVEEHVAAENAAIIKRTAENVAIAAKQTATNKAITKAKDEELAALNSRLATERLRRGKAICAGPAPEANSESSSSSADADPSSGLFRADVERDFKALIVTMESAAATGRACQSFLSENDMVP